MHTTQQKSGKIRQNKAFVNPIHSLDALGKARVRIEQIPKDEKDLPGFRRTVERIQSGDERSPKRVAVALNNAVCNCLLLKYKIVPAGMNIPPEYFKSR